MSDIVLSTPVAALPEVLVTGDNDPDRVYLRVAGRLLGGWLSVRVTQSIERCPNDFELVMTQRYPRRVGDNISAIPIDVAPGDECQLSIGKQPLVTGYVDSLSTQLGPNEHTIVVSGRGKCQDLVDCSAIWPGGQISNVSILQLAKQLAKPYGIVVTSDPGQDVGPTLPIYVVTYGETAFSVIDFMARYRGMLVYELADGSLHIGQATSRHRAASGLEEGVNIEVAQGHQDLSRRFSDYGVFSRSKNTLGDLGDLGFQVARATDKRVRRFRNHFVLSEAPSADLTVQTQRAKWESAVRFGRSLRLAITTDTWRDSAGNLFQPNTLISVSAPTLYAIEQKEWLISEVTFRAGDDGTHADLVLMPREAFSLPPVVFQTWPDVLPLPKD